MVDQHRREGFELINMHWAQLENNYTFKGGQAVTYDGQSIVYKNENFKCSEPIPVEPGTIWRIKTRSTDIGDWPVTLRGVLVDGNQRFVNHIPVDDDDPKGGISTFTIPDEARYMIVNAHQHTSNQNQTHIMKLCDWENIWDESVYGHTKDHYVNEDGRLVTTTEELAVTGAIPVQGGGVYRIANTHTSAGMKFQHRGVFLDDADEVVGFIPANPEGSLPYAFNDVVVPQNATHMRVNFYYRMQTRPDTSRTISVFQAVDAEPIYCSLTKRLKNKVWAAYGDSLTYYAEWVRMVENATGMDVYIHGYGGASANDRGDDDNYLARDDRIEKLMSCNPDIVTILTGANWRNSRLGDEQDFEVDMGQEDRTTFYGAFAYMIKKIFSMKPDVRMLIAEPLFLNYNYDKQAGFKTLERAKAVRKVADYFALPLAGTRSIGASRFTNDLMYCDNVHLSAMGAAAMARTMLRELKYII